MGNGRFRRIAWGCLVLLLVFSRTGSAADTGGIVTAALSESATVSWMEGAPTLVVSSTQSPLVQGASLGAGARIQTDGVSRVELTFRDGTVLRAAGETDIELGRQAATDGTGGQIFQVMVHQGQVWANLSRRSASDAFQLLTANAMFFGTDSIFYATVSRQGDVEVKDYSGQVTALGPFEVLMENGRFSVPNAAGKTGTDATASWRHQIDPYRKLIVVASGEATKPFRFPPKSDLTDWVRWNQERDGE